MQQSRTRWLGVALLAVAGAYLFLGYAFHLTEVPLQAASAASKCSFSEKTLVDKGMGPEETPWTVKGMVEENHGCESWLLGMEFRPTGTSRGSTLWKWQIPVEGHLSNNFTLGAQDDPAGKGRVFYGTAGASVRKISVAMSEGRSLALRPKLPTKQLRKRFGWLGNLRYFIYFYPEGRSAKTVTLYSADGKVIEKLRGIEGGFDGPGV